MKGMEVAEIAFTAGGERYDMQPPTPAIAFKVSRRLGGLADVLKRAQDGDLDVYCRLLEAACPKVPQEREALEAFVFRHLDALYRPLQGYAWSLQNGGTPPPPGYGHEYAVEPEAKPDGSAEGNAAAA